MANIELLKPLGSDIYDVGVFNQNATIIEQYLNQAIEFISEGSGIKCTYYPESSTEINIDNLSAGIHICDNLELADIQGTFPTEESKVHFEVLSFGKEDTSNFQLFVDLVSGTLYSRTQKPGDAFTTWAEIGEGGDNPDPTPGGGGSVGLRVRYPSTINLDTVTSGIYICRGVEITGGSLPDKMTGATEFQLMSFGTPTSTGTQTIIDMTDGKNAAYSRVRYIDKTSGALTTSAWIAGMGGTSGTAGGGGSGSDIQISLIEE